jgi:hypothetical protein
MSTVTKKQLERRAGLARLEGEQVGRLVDELKAGMANRGQRRSAEAVQELLELLAEHVAALREALDLPVGLTVEQAAGRLEVSEPTVRKWIRESLLEPVPGRKPVEVTQASVLGVEEALARVRVNSPEREWTRALAAYLHDRDLLDQEWAREGIAAHRRGELVKV